MKASILQTSNAFAAPFQSLLLIWLVVYALTSIDLDTSLSSLFYNIRQWGAAVIFGAIIGHVIKSKYISKFTVVFFILVLLNTFSWLIGSISFKVWAILASTYLLAFINLYDLKWVRQSIPIFVFLCAVIGIATGNTHTFYYGGGLFGGGERLTFILTSPNTLSSLAAISVLITGFRSLSRTILSTCLLAVIFFSGSRAIIFALPLLLIGVNFLGIWRDGNLTLLGKRLIDVLIVLNIGAFFSLIYLLHSGHTSDYIYLIDGLLSGRYNIWLQALDQIDVWGGLDPSIHWLSGGEKEHTAYSNRPAVDSYYIMRWAEQGVLFLPEYFLILWAFRRACRNAPKEQALIIILLTFVGFVESTMLGYGALQSLLYSSLLLFWAGITKTGTSGPSGRRNAAL